MAGRQSDHAILKWGINTKVEPPEPSAQIKPDSIQMVQYLNDLHDGLREINNLYRDVNTQGTLKAMCEDSKTWWAKENTTAAKALKVVRTELADWQAELWEIKEILRKCDSRIPDPVLSQMGGREALTAGIPMCRDSIKALKRQEKTALYELRKSVRASKKKHFNKIIVETPHNMPRKQSAFSALRDAHGNIESTAEDRARIFKDAYHPPPKPTDPECLSDMNESPTRGAPGPDRITWGVIKNLFRIDGFPFHDKGELRPNTDEPEDLPPDQHTLAIITRMFNLCIKFGLWPEMFKRAITVVIPKPGKDDYTKAKSFRPIVLLNCLGKLCEKVLANRMQFDAQKFGLVHPCQYGGTMAHSTTDARINLAHQIRAGWQANLHTSMLLLDISQFYPSINHDIMIRTLIKQGFPKSLCTFFENYLKDRRTQFKLQSTGLSDPIDVSTGVGQGSALSPILSSLYLASSVQKFYSEHPRELGNNTSLFYVDDGNIIVSSDSPATNAALIGGLYQALEKELTRKGLSAEQTKFELMHFLVPKRGKQDPVKAWPLLRYPPDGAQGPPNQVMTILGPSVYIRALNGTITPVTPTEVLRYLGFFLDPKLNFNAHIERCAAKASSTVTALQMLGNSIRGLGPLYKRRLYIANVVPVMTYGMQLWWHPNLKNVKRL
ncbi:hypothetical protein PHLCEN_2v12104 [Hermanssonia centrifuga]|uniref:Reverse transcriptase domain-containing protein n=1 Tax=Hermanssonia centrifuga TaxID=98765 RepID=A0A2R6NI70_9APHY|nr:hypothetical protein PHLCEN_2v12104 [Hermanssonia centrifuga]